MIVMVLNVEVNRLRHATGEREGEDGGEGEACRAVAGLVVAVHGEDREYSGDGDVAHGVTLRL